MLQIPPAGPRIGPRIARPLGWALIVVLAAPCVGLAAEAPAPVPAPPAAPVMPPAVERAGAGIQPLAGEAPPPRVLSMDDSVAVALENNRAIQGAVERLQRAEARVGEAVAPSRLRATAQANLTRIDQKTTINLPAGQGQPAQSITTGELYSRTATLAVTYPIDISRALRLSRTLAELGVLSSRLDLERTREQTVLDVRSAYIQVLRAQASLGVAQANLASLEEHLRQVQAFYRQEVAARYDVLRAEAQAANARQAVIASRNGIALAKASLNNAMGIDVTTPLELASSEPAPIPAPRFEESVAMAYARRTEAKQARVTVETAQRSVDLARTGNRPTLGLGFNANLNADPSLFNSRAVQWNASAILSYPLLDGGLVRSRVQQAQADVDAARVNEEQIRQGIALEVQQALLSLGEASERMEAARANLAQAREALRLAKLRFQEGIATALEVTDAQTTLTQAESNEVNAHYDYLQARARYERAVGPALAAEADVEPR